MSHRVNSEGFRLGTARFWKSELFSSYVSNFIQKFLAIYLLLKKKLNSFFFKIIFFKIIFLKGQKALVLVNAYKVIKRITNSNRRVSRPLIKKSFTGKYRGRTQAMALKAPHRYVKKSAFKRFFLAKRFPVSDFWVRKQKLLASQKLQKERGWFPLGQVKLTAFSFTLERFLSKLLLFPVEIRLKNIFSLKKKQVFNRNGITISLLNLSRIIYKKTKSFWKLKRFLYLKDAINILSLSFFYQKSGLLANYLADIMRLRRKFLFELRNIKSLLPYFRNYYFLIYGSSLKINVLGKIFGQRKRRFRCFTLKEGLKFSTQDTLVNLSYSLAHSWNTFGSFGIKVWIYKSIVKNVDSI